MENEMLPAPEPGFTPVSTISMEPTLLTEPTSARFLARQAESLLCLQLASIAEAAVPGYSYKCNELLICIATLNWALQKVIAWSVQ